MLLLARARVCVYVYVCVDICFFFLSKGFTTAFSNMIVRVKYATRLNNLPKLCMYKTVCRSLLNIYNLENLIIYIESIIYLVIYDNISP